MTVDSLLQEFGGDGWYDFRKILKEAPECRLWFVIGARRIGKTDRLLRIALELWQREGRKTMWVRDVLETMKNKAYLNDFLNDAFEFGWIHNIDEKHQWVCKEDGVHDPNDEVCIKFQSISTYSSRRGPAHPDVDLMLFDEFIPEDRKFQKGCLKGLMSLTKTVFSGREGCRCICTSNYVSLSNPYFAGLEIYPDPKKDVTKWTEKGVAVERCKGYHCAIDDGNPWNRIYAAAHYGDYADEEEDVMHRLIRKVPKGSKPDNWAVQIYGKWFKCYTGSNGYRYAKQEKETDLNNQKIIKYVTNAADLTDSVIMLDGYRRLQIEMELANGKLRFDGPNVLFAFVNLIYNI